MIGRDDVPPRAGMRGPDRDKHKDRQSNMTTATATELPVRDIILAQIADVAKQQRKRLAPLTDDLPLLESGLDSLCIAILVAALDDRLDLDPFSGNDDVAFPVTLGAFIRLYEDLA